MSDFDEEAERERLREQYEQEQRDRQATEKMSELLLQGATMTNAHCSDCGDPVFRYEGQEFCATCEKAIDRGDAAGNGQGGDGTDVTDEGSTDGEAPADAGEEPEGTHAGNDEQIQVASPDETRVQFGRGDADGPEAPDADEPEPGPTETPHGGRPRQSAPQRPPESAPEPPHEPASTPRPPGESAEGGAGAEGSAGTGDTEGDIAAARASLERTLARFARRGEAAEDPTTAREHLAAAREAAEALAALRR